MRKEAGTCGSFKGKPGTFGREHECNSRSCRPRGQRGGGGWMDVVDGNLQSLCSSAVMSTINKRNVVC